MVAPGLIAKTERSAFATPRAKRPPRHLADLDPAERRAAVVDLGERAFRAQQLSVHYFGRLVNDPALMTDIPLASRECLTHDLLPTLMTSVHQMECDGGLTRKTVWRLFDGAQVESVLMRYPAGTQRKHERTTLCVSSQAGCGIGCPFCATGQAGLTRNLSAAEIVEQVVAAARTLSQGGLPGGPGRLSNIVFMGMGEPLANYRAVMGAVRRITDPVPDGLGLSQRAVTISTVGLVPRMRELAAEGLAVTLALSLHAPDDELRNELVPINSRWPVAVVLDEARHFFDRTGRRVSIEYALIRDVNDQEWRAEMLARLLAERGRGWVHVNPIPLNPTPGSRWTASRAADEQVFVSTLRRHGLSVTLRDTRGRDIDGACGQLATRQEYRPSRNGGV